MAKSLNRRMKIIGFKDPCNPPVTPEYPVGLLLWGKEIDLVPPDWIQVVQIYWTISTPRARLGISQTLTPFISTWLSWVLLGEA